MIIKSLIGHKCKCQPFADADAADSNAVCFSRVCWYGRCYCCWWWWCRPPPRSGCTCTCGTSLRFIWCHIILHQCPSLTSRWRGRSLSPPPPPVVVLAPLLSGERWRQSRGVTSATLLPVVVTTPVDYSEGEGEKYLQLFNFPLLMAAFLSCPGLLSRREAIWRTVFAPAPTHIVPLVSLRCNFCPVSITCHSKLYICESGFPTDDVKYYEVVMFMVSWWHWQVI